MKIKMMTLAAVFCCAMSSMMFTACGSDDDDDNKVQVDDTKAVGAVMTYTFLVSDDMFDVLDMTVEYYDDNGELATEKLTQKEWTKTVKVAKLPVSLGACLKVQIKDGVDENSVGYASYTYRYTNKAYSVTATGKVVDLAEDNKTEAVFSLPYLSAQENGIIMSFLYNFSDKGQVVAGSWE